MQRIRLGLDDLSATRFAVSPLGETVAALNTLRDPGRHAVHLPWVRWAQARVEGVELPFLTPLLAGEHSLPRFLVPPPDTRLPGVEAELELVARSSAAEVRDSIDRVFPRRRSSFVDDLYAAPRRGLRPVVADLRTAHDLLVAPHWARISALLDADIAHRGRVAAEHGMAAMITGLHERLSWDGADLVLRTAPGVAPRPDETVLPGRGGLVIVPSVFVWPDVWTRSRTPTFTTLRYPARGIGALWESRQPTTRSLDRLLGRPRARLLSLLRSPVTPSELARVPGVTRGAVSQHLAVLLDAGLVARERRGRTALYVRTSLGADLADGPDQRAVGAAR